MHATHQCNAMIEAALKDVFFLFSLLGMDYNHCPFALDTTMLGKSMRMI